MSDSQKGRKFTDQHKQKIIEARKGYKTSDETRQKMSAAAKGRRYSPESYQKGAEKRKGRVESEETRRKRSESSRRWQSSPRHIVTIISTGEEIHVHLPSFCKENHLSYDAMLHVVRGDQKSHKGYIVRRITD